MSRYSFRSLPCHFQQMECQIAGLESLLITYRLLHLVNCVKTGVLRTSLTGLNQRAGGETNAKLILACPDDKQFTWDCRSLQAL